MWLVSLRQRLAGHGFEGVAEVGVLGVATNFVRYDDDYECDYVEFDVKTLEIVGFVDFFAVVVAAGAVAVAGAANAVRIVLHCNWMVAHAMRRIEIVC